MYVENLDNFKKQNLFLSLSTLLYYYITLYLQYKLLS